MASNKVFKIFNKSNDEQVSLQLYCKSKSSWLVFPSVALSQLTQKERDKYYVVEFEMVAKKKFDTNKQEIK